MSKRRLPPKQPKGNTQKVIQDVLQPDASAALRAAQGFKLRFQDGLTWEEVAKGCQYASRGAARNAVLREAQRHINKSVQEVRDIEQYRIEQLQTRCFLAAIDTENEDWTWITDRFIALSKRKSELLNLDVKPDEQLASQHYRKEIILIDEPIQEVKA